MLRGTQNPGIASSDTKSKSKGKQKQPAPPSPESPKSLPPPAGSQHQDREDSLLPPEDGEGAADNNPASSSQAKNTSSPHWAAWQDRLLTQQALILQPFLKPPRQVKAAWDSLTKALLQESTKLGPYSIIEQSGDSCWSWFERLVKYQQVCYPPNFFNGVLADCIIPRKQKCVLSRQLALMKRSMIISRLACYMYPNI